MVTRGQAGLIVACPDGSYVMTNCRTKYIFPYMWKYAARGKGAPGASLCFCSHKTLSHEEQTGKRTEIKYKLLFYQNGQSRRGCPWFWPLMEMA